jgi:class 3 adenylate cyclase/tetratricopeptide (TPR) repeat protein
MSTVEDLLEKLKKLKPDAPFEEPLAIWHEHDSQSWKRNLELYQQLGHRFVKQDEPLLGLDVLTAGLRHDPSHPRLRQLQALAFAATGATERARGILEKLKKEGYKDGDTFGILARTYRDSWHLSGDPAHLAVARDTYRTGYEEARSTSPPNHDDALYTGINVATASLLLNDAEEARRVAREVRWHCQEKLKDGPNYWAEATLGEAALLLGELEAAREHYAAAAEIGRGNWRDLASTRRQAHEILRHLNHPNPRELDGCFGIGPIVVFAGHMIDTAERLRTKPERFPARFAPALASAIREVLRGLKPSFGYSSAACGSDILFLEAMRDMKLAGYVVLPFSRAEFCNASVKVAAGDWEGRYWDLLKWAGKARVHQVSEHPLVLTSASYDYANMVLQGMAAIHADRLDADLVGVAVWDGAPGDGPGGTASIVARWLDAGPPVQFIHPSGKLLGEYDRPLAVKPAGDTRNIAVLFADVVNFSQLTEAQMPLFKDKFLAAVAGVVARMGEPELKSTWGDGLFFAFEDVRQAGLLALELQQEIAGKGWEEMGLPAGLNVRIGLHAGPALQCVNPVTDRRDFLGFHVSRGARIEPKTDTGQIFCSQEYAALVRAKGIDDFTFEYVGRIELPKQAGVIPLYNLRRKK